MKAVSSLRRRGLAVLAGALLGLTGALTMAGPASAHHSEVSGVPICDAETGEWVITWTINSVAPRSTSHFRLIYVHARPTDHPVIGLSTAEPGYPYPTSEPLIGTQRVPGNTEVASLGIQAKWNNGFREKIKRSGVVRLDGTCEKEVPPPSPEPEPTPPAVHSASACDELVVVLDNPEDGAPVSAIVHTNMGGHEVVELAPGESTSVSFPAAEGLNYQVIIDDETVQEGGWQDPGDCEEEFEVPVAAAATCDSLIIEVTNPLSDAPIQATVTVGDTTEVLTVEPESTAEATFPAQEGTVATVSVEGGESIDIAWEAPEECDEGPAQPAPSEPAEPGLPVTGSKTPLVVGAAVLLLAVGGGLFWFARRRRITFTA